MFQSLRATSLTLPVSQNQHLSHHPDLLSSLHFLLIDAFLLISYLLLTSPHGRWSSGSLLWFTLSAQG